MQYLVGARPQICIGRRRVSGGHYRIAVRRARTKCPAAISADVVGEPTSHYRSRQFSVSRIAAETVVDGRPASRYVIDPESLQVIQTSGRPAKSALAAAGPDPEILAAIDSPLAGRSEGQTLTFTHYKDSTKETFTTRYRHQFRPPRHSPARSFLNTVNVGDSRTRPAPGIATRLIIWETTIGRAAEASQSCRWD